MTCISQILPGIQDAASWQMSRLIGTVIPEPKNVGNPGGDDWILGRGEIQYINYIRTWYPKASHFLMLVSVG